MFVPSGRSIVVAIAVFLLEDLEIRQRPVVLLDEYWGNGIYALVVEREGTPIRRSSDHHEWRRTTSPTIAASSEGCVIGTLWLAEISTSSRFAAVSTSVCTSSRRCV